MTPLPRLARGRAGDERGEVTTTTLIFPALLFVILVSVQFALAYHAKSVLTAAAQDGARAAQAEGSTRQEGERAASEFVRANAARLVEDVDVTVAGDADAVTVVVRGEVSSVVPGLHLTVAGRASGPVERFRPEGQR